MRENLRMADFLPLIYRMSRQAKLDRQRQVDRLTRKVVDHSGEFRNANEDVKRKAAQKRRGLASEYVREQEPVAAGLAPDPWEYVVARITARAELTQKQLEDWAARIVLDAPPSDTTVAVALASLEQAGFAAALLRDVEQKYPEIGKACQADGITITASRPDSSLTTHNSMESASEKQNIVLGKVEMRILHVLAKSKTPLTQPDIAERTKPLIRSRRAIGLYLTKLREIGLIYRPNGSHRGDIITLKGRAVLAR